MSPWHGNLGVSGFRLAFLGIVLFNVFLDSGKSAGLVQKTYPFEHLHFLILQTDNL